MHVAEEEYERVNTFQKMANRVAFANDCLLTVQ